MSKPLDMTSLRELFASGEMWGAIGVVRARGTASHYDMRDGDVLVDVDLGPEGIPAWCRLGGAAGGAAMGIWRVPPVGTEVAVIVPRGDVRCDPMIVAVLSSGEVHADLDADTLLIVNTERVSIKSTDDEIIIQDGIKGAAREDDTTDCGTLIHTPSTVGSACVLTFVPPGGTVPPAVAPVVNIALSGVINSSSSTVKIG
jgi:hypothetical protein